MAALEERGRNEYLAALSLEANPLVPSDERFDPRWSLTARGESAQSWTPKLSVFFRVLRLRHGVAWSSPAIGRNEL